MREFHQNTKNKHQFSRGSQGFYDPSGNERIFSTESLKLSFGNIHALNGVDFKVHRGEIVFLTGVSGAGKTTLLKVLGGVLTPDKGKLKRSEHRVFTAPIFQDLKLLENKSCEKNLMVSYDSSVYKSKKEFISDMRDLCDMLGVSNRLHILARDANGGMRQKIAFIRAMLTRPDVILADEPTSALDFENAKKIFDILNYYNVKQGLTVVWATHNRDLANKFTGRIVHMDKGRLIYSGHACFI
jgi:ABC-type multidrug transport system ATPase subunit